MLNMTENRHAHRVVFNCLVKFESGECRHVCELIDISPQGALIGACSGATPQAGTRCKLIISLDESSEIQIEMVGTIAYRFSYK